MSVAAPSLTPTRAPRNRSLREACAARADELCWSRAISVLNTCERLSLPAGLVSRLLKEHATDELLAQPAGLRDDQTAQACVERATAEAIAAVSALIGS